MHVAERNVYSTSALLSTCVVLKRLATSHRWMYLEVFSRKHTQHLSKIFWEAGERFVKQKKGLLAGENSARYTRERAEFHATHIKKKVGDWESCIWFIDGTVFKIAYPDGTALQKVVYSCQKRIYALKFQAIIITPDDMFNYLYGPLEGSMHDWTLCWSSNLEGQPHNALNVNGQQFCIYFNSGYNHRAQLEIPFQGSSNNVNRLRSTRRF